MAPPQIPMLTGADNLANWKYALIKHLRTLGIAEVVLQQDHGKKTPQAMAQVMDIIVPTIQPIRPRLEACGWNFGRPGQDPKGLYDLIVTTIRQKPTDAAAYDVVKQFMQLQPSQYKSLADYLRQFHYLKVQQARYGIILDDNMALWLVIDAIRRKYPIACGRLLHEMATGRLTWKVLGSMVKQLPNK